MGQYAHGNQPGHHVLYLYNYVGQPWKTQKWVRKVLEELYSPGPDGLTGDEDNGSMSSWYIFSALGFYPVSPGVPIYVFGSPLFKKATLYLPDGKTFVINASNNNRSNKYIQSVKLNGKNYTKTWITHSIIIEGGQLEFIMGPQPNMNWGIMPEDVPFSLTEVNNN